MTEASRLEIAQCLASEIGLAVFPLHYINGAGCSCGSPNCRSPGKHPLTLNGVHAATSVASQIDAWWAQHPMANIGIATGQVSEIVVVDVDPRNGGDESFERLRRELQLPETTCVRTGGGGHHHYFR